MDVCGWDGGICLQGGILCFSPNLVGEFALIIGVSVLFLEFCILNMWK